MNKIRNIELEGILWILGLAYLMLINPYKDQEISFCILKNLGFEYCPGCGLGKSISLIFHFDFINSFYTHPIGFIALILIVHRLLKLIFRTYNNFKENIYG